MATADTRFPIGWRVPGGVRSAGGGSLEDALAAGAALSGAVLAAFTHPDGHAWWLFGLERMVVVQPVWVGGYSTRAHAYPPDGMPSIQAHLEAEGWELVSV